MPVEGRTAYQGVARLRKYILVVPLLVASMPIAVLGLIMMGYWVWGILLFLCIFVLNWSTETCPVHLSGNQLKETGGIRVLTYNVNRAHEISVNSGTTQGLIRFILRQEADVILLQEYNADLYPEVRERLMQDYPYGSGMEAGSRFKSVFSKFPVEEVEQLWVRADDSRYELLQHAWYCKSGDGEREILPVCSMVLRVGNSRLRIVNCHLMSNNYSVVIRNVRRKRRNLMRAIMPVMKRMDYGYAARKLQARIVCQHLASCKERAVIMCGDINDISGSSTLRPFKQMGLKDAWWSRGLGFGFTFHGMRMRLRLDHFLYTDNALQLKNVYVPNSQMSDHDPIVADFSVKSC